MSILDRLQALHDEFHNEIADFRANRFLSGLDRMDESRFARLVELRFPELCGLSKGDVEGIGEVGRFGARWTRSMLSDTNELRTWLLSAVEDAAPPDESTYNQPRRYVKPALSARAKMIARQFIEAGLLEPEATPALQRLLAGKRGEN